MFVNRRNNRLILLTFDRLREPYRFSLISGILTCAFIILYAYDPATSNLYPASPFRELTGLYCPGCGTLRGLHQILHGHIGAAFAFNPLMVLCLPFLGWTYIKYAVEVLGKQRMPAFLIPSQWIMRFFYVVVTYWLLRNLPIAPFSWLAPSAS